MYTIKNTQYKNIPISNSLLHTKQYVHLLKIKRRSLSEHASEKKPTK